MKAVEDAKTEIKSFLENKKVLVKPIIRPERWSTILSGPLDRAFMFENTSIGISAPLDRKMGGTIKRVLDNIVKFKTSQYDDEVTEEEFFERMLDRDLSLTKKVDNFWKKDPIANFEIFSDGITLDLTNPEHKVKYLILLANRSKIAPAGIKNPRAKMTYQFQIIDNEVEESKQTNKRNVKKEAMLEYTKIKENKNSLRDILLLSTGGINRTAKEGWLSDKVFDFADQTPEKFLGVVKDQWYTDKLFVAKALYIREIQLVGDTYKVNGIELGDLISTIHYFKNPKNNILYTKILQRIENSKEFSL
tara:strand:- start:3535 stop:4449 length:915 start_codon:yes stop_codon:yes gene_type:complete